MREVAIACAALLAGFLLGGIGPRNELRLRKNAAEDAAKPCEEGAVGRDLAVLFGNAGAPPRRVADLPKDAAPDEVLAVRPEARDVADRMAAEQDAALAEAAAEARQVPTDDELETARAALALRRAQARASLEETAAPDEAQLEAIDATATQMNAALTTLSQDLASMLKEGKEPDRREAMEFGADALDVLLSAEDAMRNTLTPAQRAAMDEEALDPLSWIDPSLLDVLAGLGE